MLLLLPACASRADDTAVRLLYKLCSVCLPCHSLLFMYEKSTQQ